MLRPQARLGRLLHGRQPHQGIRSSNELVRKGGAAARIMLIEAAAAEWKVPASGAGRGRWQDHPHASNRTTTYGKVASAAAKVEPPTDIKLKDPKDWKIIGKGMKRLDTPDKTQGKTIYGIDIRLPGNALRRDSRHVRSTAANSRATTRPRSRTARASRRSSRWRTTASPSIADSWWRAKTALDAMPIVWDEGPNAKVSSASIAAWLAEGLDVDDELVGNKSGDLKAALEGAAKKVEAVYAYPYQSHVTMEPQNATARYTDDKCEVWGSTQNGEAALATASEATGLPVPKCEVYKTFLGGGFGRRSPSRTTSGRRC